MTRQTSRRIRWGELKGWTSATTDMILDGPQTIRRQISQLPVCLRKDGSYNIIPGSRGTGALVGIIQINPRPLAQLTNNLTVYSYGRTVINASRYVDISVGKGPKQACCSFLGNVALVDLNQLSHCIGVTWNFRMLPTGHDWSRAEVSEASLPLIQHERRSVLALVNPAHWRRHWRHVKSKQQRSS
jgi:hypothetical protein